jgi:hypothetical protein
MEAEEPLRTEQAKLSELEGAWIYWKRHWTTVRINFERTHVVLGIPRKAENNTKEFNARVNLRREWPFTAA